MKIAVPSIDHRGLESEIAHHFGRAPYYTIVHVKNGEIVNVEVVRQPFQQHGPGDIPNFLKSLGVNVVIAYGMGPRAQGFFRSLGMEVITGASGRVGEVVKNYLRGNLKADENWIFSDEFRLHDHGFSSVL